MNEKLKVIVEELGKEPFNKKYNVISFDALGSEQLLQVCTALIFIIGPCYECL